MVLHFYELKKLPPLANTDNGRDLWLKLFNAETEEELTKIEEMGVSFMCEAIVAYRHVAASPEFREMERVRSKTRHDEAQAIYHVEQRGVERANANWQGVVSEKDTLIASQATENTELRLQLAKLQAQLNNSK